MTFLERMTEFVAIALIAAIWLLAYCLLCPAEARERRHHQTVAPSAGHCWVSYYSHGNRVASGRRFDKHGMTAAHRSLPFGTRVRISRGDRHITVTVNDRGPFIAGRMFDLSLGAARAIGIIQAGVARVAFEVLP
ncbi:septal ring lytic transglycosylase RlpA family protein [Rhodopseudomonas palustris]|nr:septal ring lytic transglycosylase RlpA family protein [Rhodopseudomonas palustris]